MGIARNMRRVSRFAAGAGFTLVEMIMVITITGIIGAMVAVFIRSPVDSYVDSARRAELSDIADTALRRIIRDLRLALPNSVRVAQSPAGTFYLEFLLTSGGGRYRTDKTAGGLGDPLNFVAADGSFDVLGPTVTFAGGESIVMYNLGTGFTGADAYQPSAASPNDNNRAAYGGAAGAVSNIVLSGTKLFPFASPGNRFHVVQYAVTYKCDPVAGEVRRYWNYGILPGQPAPPVTANNAQLARNVTACAITYDQNAIQGRNGVVTLRLTLGGAGGEVVSLFEEAHVSNVP